MFLTGEFKSCAIKSDIRETQVYERMRNECTLEPLNETTNDTLSITVFPIQAGGGGISPSLIIETKLNLVTFPNVAVIKKQVVLC